LFGVVIYIALAGSQYLAASPAEKPNLSSLRRAVALAPGNAEYRYRLGRYYWLAEANPQAARQFYRSAVTLNPHEARYWLELASVDLSLANTDQQKDALEQAIQAAPTSPSVAWEAANFYWVRGDEARALQEFRVVLRNDPAQSGAALKACWRIRPDADSLLQDVVPHDAGSLSLFLDFLIAGDNRQDAAKVWNQIAALQRPVETRYVFVYIHYLIDQRDVAQARLVWQQAAELAGLSGYQPSPENLVVNGDFSLPMLNGGFDWLYEQSSDVTLALDSTESHSGHRSLSIGFDSRGMEDAGIRQLIPAEPRANYEFSAYFKAREMQGAGAPRFVIQDAFTGNLYFVSDDLKEADFWKPVEGRFSTGPDARLFILRIQRFPPGNAIRGKLWIDGVRLAEKQVTEGTH
jgi:hypothetical protein